MEYVQERLLTLTPLWEIVKLNKILPNYVVREHMNRMRQLEEKIQMQRRRVNDFKNLIDFTIELKELLNARTKKLQLTFLNKKVNELLHNVISSRFGMAERNFHNKLDFWKFWISTYKHLNWFDKLEQVYRKHNKTYGQKDATLWIEGALLPVRRNGPSRINESREIFVECLRVHKKNSRIYIAWCKLEFFCVDLINQNTKKGESKKNYQTIELIYTDGINNCGNQPAFYLELYQAVKNFPSSSNFRTKLLRDMEDNCGNNEDTYDILAQVNFNLVGGDVKNEQNVMKCISYYEKGIETVHSEKMYQLYIDALDKIAMKITVSSGNDELLRYQVIENICSVYERAHRKHFLPMNGYFAWIQATKQLDDVSIDFNEELSKKSITKAKLCLLEEQEWNGESEAKKGRMALEDSGTRTCDEVVNLSLEKYPSHWKFVYEKVIRIMKNPINLHVWYGEARIYYILDLLRKVEDESGESEILWSKAFQFIMTRKDRDKGILKSIEELILMAPTNGGIQEILSIQYLRVLFSKKFPDNAEKFFKKLSKPSKAVCSQLEFLQTMWYIE